MTTFDWLILAHLVADWLLQNDWMARNKQSHWFSSAILLHCSIYTTVLLLTLWFAATASAINPAYLPFGLLLFLSHWVIDAGRLAYWWIYLVGQTPAQFMKLMVDQIMHLLVLAGLIHWLL